MCDLSELEPTTKEIAICIIIVFVVLAGVFFSGYLLGIRNAGKDVSNNGDGINRVGEQLGQAVSNQQQITDGIKDAEHTSAGIEKTSTAIAESARHIETGVGEAAGLIDSCQQILGRIRNRGQANTPAN